MSNRYEFTLPVGRYVSGDMAERRTLDHNRKPITDDKQKTFDFGVALRKDDPATVEAIMGIVNWAKGQLASNPALVARIDNWVNTFQGFSMKIADGDKPGARGVNENTVGHYVFYFSSNFDIRTAKWQGNQWMGCDVSEVKRGYYVSMSGNCMLNGLTDQNAGIYMNPEWVGLVAAGDEIVGGRSAEEALGGVNPGQMALPPGARALPAAGGALPGAPSSSGLGNAPAPGIGGTAPATGAPAQSTPQTGLPGAGAPGSETTASPSEAAQHPPHPGILGGGLPS